MRQATVLVLLLAAVSSLGGCSSDLRVRTEFGPDAQLSGQESYGWLITAQATPGSVPIDPDLIEEMIREALVRELEARGYRYQEKGKPDLLVFFHAGADDVERTTAVHRDRAGGSVSAPTRYRKGELVIELSDASSGALAWRGQARAEILRGVSLDERHERIDRAVRELLERLPARAP